MAKYVVCTALNSGVERNKHTNAETILLTSLLEKRWNDVPKHETNRYCPLHSTTGSAMATGQFAPIVAKMLAERAEFSAVADSRST